MARLSNLPKNTLLRDMPERDKLREAIQFLKANPEETPATAARACCVRNEDTVRKAWQRERKKMGTAGSQWGGHNKILRPDQHTALIQYAVSHAINGGKGATKQMMYNCAMWMRTEDNKTAPSWKWFSQWLKSTPELHTIKTKPIASHRVDLHTEQSLREWFETQYRLVLEETSIYYSD
jgi:hypothetical protein